MNDFIVDLHIHSNNSLEGKVSPIDILNMAEAKGIKYLSITDHDNVKAYYDILGNDHEFTGKLISGLEADATINEITVDLSCYGFKIDNVDKWATEKYTTVEVRQNKIYERLKQICKDNHFEIDESMPYNPSMEFAHQAIYRQILDNCGSLFEEYNILSSSDFYRISTSNEKFPLYLNMNFLWATIDEVCDIIHQNNGLVFLAHPYHYPVDVKELLDMCKGKIDGIEVYHYDNSPEEIDFLYQYAKDNNLHVSAGSDFHGTPEQNNLGINLANFIDPTDLTRWADNTSFEN